MAQQRSEDKDTIYISSESQLKEHQKEHGKTYIKVDINARGKDERRIGSLVNTKLKTPSKAKKENIQGNVVLVKYVIDTNGNTKDATILTSASPSLDEEALRVINSLTNLLPAEKDGKPVQVQMIQPIVFRKLSRPDNLLSTTGFWTPEYKGGINALMAYLRNNLRYPPVVANERLEGLVIVRFDVSPEGKVLNPEITQSMHPECDKEAIRVVSEMQDWLPAVNNGKYVSSYQYLPVRFKINSDKFQNPATSRTY
ncbi:MAG: energy transducer TonB [Dysgonomonas sp.]|nr:energy transducer TonB [Dysgonomonas sp.]